MQSSIVQRARVGRIFGRMGQFDDLAAQVRVGRDRRPQLDTLDSKCVPPSIRARTVPHIVRRLHRPRTARHSQTGRGGQSRATEVARRCQRDREAGRKRGGISPRTACPTTLSLNVSSDRRYMRQGPHRWVGSTQPPPFCSLCESTRTPLLGKPRRRRQLKSTGS
jgi:hypothetical protein